MNLLNLINEVPSENMGGLRTKFYWGVADNVATWPVLPSITAEIDIDALNVLTGSLAMDEGSYLYSGYLTPDSGELKDEEQGEVDGMSYKHIFEFFNPGLKRRLLGFMRYTNNADLFFIAPDAEGQYRMVGSKQYPAKKQAGGGSTTGKAAADRKGASLSFFSYGNGPAPVLNMTEQSLDALLQQDSGGEGV